MLHIYCDIQKDGNHLKFIPDEKFSLEYNFLFDREHLCNECNIENIIDIRKYLLNNCVNSNIHLYAIFYDNLNLPISVTNLRGISTISTYDRIKEKVNRRKVLSYETDDSETFNTEVINYENRELLRLGFTKQLKFRECAYESSGCFAPYISDDGEGFIGINLICNTQITPKYAIVIGYPSKVTDEIPDHSETESDESVNSEIDLYYAPPDLPVAEEYGVEPSAPPQYAIAVCTPEPLAPQPSAPDFIDEDPNIPCVEIVYAEPVRHV